MRSKIKKIIMAIECFGLCVWMSTLLHASNDEQKVFLKSSNDNGKITFGPVKSHIKYKSTRKAKELTSLTRDELLMEYEKLLKAYYEQSATLDLVLQRQIPLKQEIANLKLENSELKQALNKQDPDAADKFEKLEDKIKYLEELNESKENSCGEYTAIHENYNELKRMHDKLKKQHQDTIQENWRLREKAGFYDEVHEFMLNHTDQDCLENLFGKDSNFVLKYIELLIEKNNNLANKEAESNNNEGGN